jgi:hypothetical protein
MEEGRELGEGQSEPCADNSAASAAAKRQINVSAKAGLEKMRMDQLLPKLI